MRYSVLGATALVAAEALASDHYQAPFQAHNDKDSFHARIREGIFTDDSRDITPGIISDPLKVANKTYDYVIAGGGLTGLTLAAQLLETPKANFTVLIIENGFYGSQHGPIIDDLNTYGQIFGSRVDHAYETTVQPVNNRAQIMRSGNGLGGSTLVNGGTWTRPHKAQLDSWSTVFGNTEWSWDKLVPYMNSIEKPRDPTDLRYNITPGSWHHFDPKCHNQDNFTGRVHVGARDRGSDRGWSPVIPALMYTVNQTYPQVSNQKDLCCGDPHGVSMFMNTLSPGQVRADAARSWLYPVVANETTRHRVTVLTGHMAGKVHLQKKNDPSSGAKYKATGVEFGVHNQDGWKWDVTAEQEVLVASGSAISPLILQYSGIGTRDVLDSVGIAQKVDLPVGLNLQEQTNTNLRTEVVPKGNGQGQAAYFAAFEEVFGPDAMEYKGILNNHENLKKWADETVSGGGFHNKTALLLQYQNYQKWLLEDNVAYAELFLDTDNRINFDLMNFIPFTRGYVKILNKDPYLRSFEFNPRFFENELDVAGQAAVSRLARNLTRSYNMTEFAGKEVVPGDLLKMDATLEDWKHYVKQNFRANYHPVGTCSMMAKELGGVVDQNARVYGVDRLRVVDSSIPPTQLSSHVMSVFYGMSVKIAEAVIDAYQHEK
ncbi:hypothetical protein ETB97_004613 [Aspergillus alliaceus]|uniref:glucose oxidase n=1 Tax=Petromyces alliaceus TaxID=209559 RepID=A0A5N6G272_PETAA|nr:uncharacterized protein BDW43DRAFT_299188 [Aspergillus alliaceus]KAB8235290.1 hypothetical protein BDW43DRAFT_299188 [Aspergillus alliaceus]KAF5858294.1 hypothetical protein ETB97_004613 [Aspergillus burnettii]